MPILKNRASPLRRDDAPAAGRGREARKINRLRDAAETAATACDDADRALGAGAADDRLRGLRPRGQRIGQHRVGHHPDVHILRDRDGMGLRGTRTGEAGQQAQGQGAKGSAGEGIFHGRRFLNLR